MATNLRRNKTVSPESSPAETLRAPLQVTVGGPPLDELIHEVTRLFHRLSALTTEIHEGGMMSAGRRAILMERARMSAAILDAQGAIEEVGVFVRRGLD